MAVNGHSAPQFSDKRVHFADIYKEPKVAHFSDVPRYIFYEGELHNYVVYTFTIQNRSTLLMANMMGTDTDYTVLRLFIDHLILLLVDSEINQLVMIVIEQKMYFVIRINLI